MTYQDILLARSIAQQRDRTTQLSIAQRQVEERRTDHDGPRGGGPSLPALAQHWHDTIGDLFLRHHPR